MYPLSFKPTGKGSITPNLPPSSAHAFSSSCVTLGTSLTLRARSRAFPENKTYVFLFFLSVLWLTSPHRNHKKYYSFITRTLYSNTHYIYFYRYPFFFFRLLWMQRVVLLNATKPTVYIYIKKKHYNTMCMSIIIILYLGLIISTYTTSILNIWSCQSKLEVRYKYKKIIIIIYKCNIVILRKCSNRSRMCINTNFIKLSCTKLL